MSIACCRTYKSHIANCLVNVIGLQKGNADVGLQHHNMLKVVCQVTISCRFSLVIFGYGIQFVQLRMRTDDSPRTLN